MFVELIPFDILYFTKNYALTHHHLRCDVVFLTHALSFIISDISSPKKKIKSPCTKTFRDTHQIAASNYDKSFYQKMKAHCFEDWSQVSLSYLVSIYLLTFVAPSEIFRTNFLEHAPLGFFRSNAATQSSRSSHKLVPAGVAMRQQSR